MSDEALAFQGDPSAVNVHQLADQIELIIKLREEESEQAALKSAITKKLEVAENYMLELLQASGLKNFRTDLGLVSVSYRTSVRLPQTPEDWAKLKLAAIQEGLEHKITMNSQTLNSWYRDRVDAAKRGEIQDPTIPGTSEITITPQLSLRKA